MKERKNARGKKKQARKSPPPLVTHPVQQKEAQKGQPQEMKSYMVPLALVLEQVQQRDIIY